MNTKKTVAITFIILFLLVIIIASVMLIYGTLSKKSFDISLAKADLLIQSSGYQEAENILKPFIGKKLSLLQSRRFLKRLYSVAISTNRYKMLWTESRSVLKRYPSDKLVADMYLYASAQTDNPDLSFLTKLIEKRTVIDDIVRFTALKGMKEHKDFTVLTDNSPITSLLYSPSPLRYEEAFTESGFLPFSAKAVAYYMKAGSSDKAWNLAIKSSLEDQFPLLCSYMAFDRGLYEKSLALLEKYQPSFEEVYLDLFRADILYYSGQKSHAGLILEDFIKKNSEFSWKPYFNLFVLSDESGYNGTGIIDSFRSVQKIFDDDGPFNRSFHHFLQKAGETDEAQSTIDSYMKKHPEDIRTLVYFLKKTNSILSPQQLIYKSFELLDKGGDFESVGSYLVWLLINTADYGGLKRLCEYKEASSASWYISALITLYLQSKDKTYEKIIVEYAQQPQKNPLSEYHIGLYYTLQNDFAKAEGHFLQAVNSSDGKLQGLAWYQLSKNSYKNKDQKKALEYIKEGLNCDPENLTIRNYASILENSMMEQERD